MNYIYNPKYYSDTTQKNRLKDAAKKVEKEQPFFSGISNKLSFIPQKNMHSGIITSETAITFGSKTVKNMNDSLLESVVAHQFLHIAFNHIERGRKLSLAERSQGGCLIEEFWNAATDISVNQELQELGYDVPQDWNTDEQGNFKGLNSEQIYRKLFDESDDEDMEDKYDLSWCTSSGNINIDQPQKGTSGLEEDEDGDEDEEGQEPSRRPSSGGKGIVIEQKGRISSEAPEIDWLELLRNRVNDYCQKDYTWSQPSRRHLHTGMYLPGTAPAGLTNLICCIDTSGSISQDTLGLFLQAAQDISDNTLIDKITIYDVDTQINDIARYNSGDIIRNKYRGGGGNDFTPFFQYLAENSEEASDVPVILMFSDMYIDHEEFGGKFAPDVPVIWFSYGHPHHSTFNVPDFGEVIQITDPATDKPYTT